MKIERRLPTLDEHALVKDGFDVLNQSNHVSFKEKEPFGFVITQEDKLVGVLDGVIKFDWMYVDILFVFEEFRGHNYGQQLMQQAEDMARAQNLVGIYVDTGNWQAGPFYEKIGYEQYAVFDDFPKGFKRLCYRKYL